jgi:pimeloyl-ACP methyl ester carboxylesterase
VSSSEIQGLLHGVPYGLADEREVLEATRDLTAGDHDAWFDALTALGERVEASGESLRAATYRYAGFRHVLGTHDPSRWESAWLAHRRCLDAAVASRPEIERFDVPWGPGPFPAFMIRGRDERLLDVQSGFDAAWTDALMHGVLDAVARGWSAVAFDGPGQGATRVVGGVGPVDDWAAVIAAVVDAVHTRADVRRVAVLGVDDGAALALLAAARDPRVVALVCDPGVIRPIDGALGQLPPDLVTSWREQDDDPARFQRLVAAASHDAAAAFAIAKLTEPWPGASLYDVLGQLDRWDVSPLLDDVAVPVLVGDGDLADALGARTAGLGSAVGPARRKVIHDWLDEVVPAGL